MKLDWNSPALPTTEMPQTNMGAPKFHAGVTKKEYYTVAIFSAAIASGKDVYEAAALTADALEIMDDGLETVGAMRNAAKTVTTNQPLGSQHKAR